MPILSEDNKNVVLVKTWHKRNIKTETYRFLITQFGINSPSCDAVNHMMLDMMAAIARKDYEQRRQHQA